VGIVVSFERFLKQRAVKINVDGNYTLHRRYDASGKVRTYACRATRVSPFRMIVAAPVVGRVGDRLSSYFGPFGALEGSISDTTEDSFLLEMEMTRDRRAKFSEQLTWLEKKQKDPSVLEQREELRLVPQMPHATLTLADGSHYRCFVIDMSPSGCGISAELQPAIGTPLAIGACIGRVVRLFDTGFAVKFVEKQNLKDLERLLARSEPQGRSGVVAAAPA
jgi:PilZ domain